MGSEIVPLIRIEADLVNKWLLVSELREQQSGHFSRGSVLALGLQSLNGQGGVYYRR